MPLGQQQPIARVTAAAALVVLLLIPTSGCDQSPSQRFVFIDGGAHKGEPIAGFEKTATYAEHPWEVYAFQANPNLISQIPAKQNLTVLNKAIWIHDGTVDFYLAKSTPSSSILKHKKTGKLSKVPIRVESVDFSNWVEERFSRDDYVMLKLDIEGAEYQVLDKMIRDGSIAYIDKLYIEFHNVKVDIPREKDEQILRQLEKWQIPVIEENPGMSSGGWFEASMGR